MKTISLENNLDGILVCQYMYLVDDLFDVPTRMYVFICSMFQLEDIFMLKFTPPVPFTIELYSIERKACIISSKKHYKKCKKIRN